MKNNSRPQEYGSIEVEDYDFLSGTDTKEIVDKLDSMLQDAVKKKNRWV
ncbi:MAG: hypothetical protein U5N58_01235 [Actinomycetota bacterium]|nr:hypothetical protein [Actinomycetota bacterium]